MKIKARAFVAILFALVLLDTTVYDGVCQSSARKGKRVLQVTQRFHIFSIFSEFVFFILKINRNTFMYTMDEAF